MILVMKVPSWSHPSQILRASYLLQACAIYGVCLNALSLEILVKDAEFDWNQL